MHLIISSSFFLEIKQKNENSMGKTIKWQYQNIENHLSNYFRPDKKKWLSKGKKNDKHRHKSESQLKHIEK